MEWCLIGRWVGMGGGHMSAAPVTQRQLLEKQIGTAQPRVQALFKHKPEKGVHVHATVQLYVRHTVRQPKP